MTYHFLVSRLSVQDLQIVQIILQGGSFGLLVVMIVWFGRTAFPSLLAMFKEQAGRFEEALERKDVRHDAELARRDAAVERQSVIIAKLADQVENLKDEIKQMQSH